jgi:hypothetical protein
MLDHVLGNRRLGDLEAELQKFTMDARGASPASCGSHGSNFQERQVGDAGSSARPHMGFDVAKAGGDAQTLAVALCASADLPKPEYARNMALSGIPIRAAGRDIKTSVFLPLSMIIVFPTGEVACLAENGLELIYHRVAILARVGSRLENFGLVEEGI